MWSLTLKEIRAFLNSLIGYTVVSVFLLFTGLFMWVLPTDANVLDNGYADLSTLFTVAPWVFLFLIPAITMRSFTDERSSGTMELLHTRPLTDLQIVLAKYLASVGLIIFALLPTLTYFFSVIALGAPAGNIDSGSVWGSHVGLLFLGAGFAAIGVFASGVAPNQIVAFIVAVFLSWALWVGLSSFASFELLGSLDHWLFELSMNTHYSALGRGVIDSRDLLYFLSVICLFLHLTRTRLAARKW